MLALPLLDGDSVLQVTPPFESQSYVALTLRAMADFGVSVRREGNTFFIPGNQRYRPRDGAVEGDASQAAFPAVLGAVKGGITVTGLREDSCQGDRVIFDILRRCGAGMTAVSYTHLTRRRCSSRQSFCARWGWRPGPWPTPPPRPSMWPRPAT